MAMKGSGEEVEGSGGGGRGVAAFTCEECGRVFRRRSNLSRHQRLHSGERPYQCPQCHRPFAHHSSLQHHLRLHSGERPYQCAVCLRTFRQRPNYSLHLKTHTGEKHFRCSACGKEFAQRVHLTTHARLHSGDLPYECEDCGKRFSQRCHLTRHRGTAAQPGHVCTLCTRKFVSQPCLNSHLQRTHGGVLQGTHRGGQCDTKQKHEEDEDKSVGVRRKIQGGGGGRTKVRAKVECEVCHKSFHKPSHLHHHRYTHTGERPYPCPQCGRRFSEASSLRRHMTSHIRAHLRLSSHPLTPTASTPPHSHTPDTITPSQKDESHHTKTYQSDSTSHGSAQESLYNTPATHNLTNIEDLQARGRNEHKIEDSHIRPDKETTNATNSNIDKQEDRTSVNHSCSFLPQTSQSVVAVSLFLFGKKVKEETGMEDGEEMSVKEEFELIEEGV